MPDAQAFLSSDVSRPAQSEMARRIREHNWATTPLGSIDSWPQSLRTALDVCLGSRFPMFLWWGPDLINLYNDPYIPIMGKRHPVGLGMPAAKLWAEVWPTIGPQIDAVLNRGEASWHRRVPLHLERNGFSEEAFFTWSHSPIHREDGRVGGVLCIVMEETDSVRAERERDRLASQRQLALDAAGMGWWHYDPLANVTTFDQRAREIFNLSGKGRPEEEVLKRLHPDDLPILLANSKAALDPRNPKPYAAEYRIVMDDGSIRKVEAHGTAAFAGEGDERRAISFVGTIADVTERRRAAEQPRLILERITDATYSLDRQWRFTYLNRAAERLLQRSAEELLGRVVWDEFPQAVGTPFYHEYHRAIAQQTVVEFEAFYPPLDCWFSVRAHPSADGLSVFFQNVNQRRQTEAALRESQRRWELAVTSTNDGIWDWNLLTDTLYWSPRCKEMLGYADNELQVSREVVSGMIHPEDRERAWQTALQHVEGQSPRYADEYRLRHKDGTYRWVLARGLAYRDASGRCERFVGSHTDITERKQAEQALREARERADFLSRALENSSLAFASGLPDGSLLIFNPAFTDLVGYSEAELRALSWNQDLTPEEWRAHEAERLTALHETGEPQLYEKEYIRKDGSRVPIEVKVHLVQDESGRPLYYYAFISDISERKRAEAESAATKARLEAFIRNAPVGLAMFDRQMRYVRVSSQWMHDVGLPADMEVVGQSHYDLFPQLPEAWTAAHRRGLAGEVCSGEDHWCVADGTLRVIRWAIHPWGDSGTETGGIIIYAEDVTAKRQIEQQLRTSEERLALSIGAAELGTFYCPMPLGRIEWNDTCKAHFWLPPDADINFDLFYSIIHPDDREQTREAVERAVFSREPYDIEYRTVAPDGRQRWVRAKGRAYYDSAGNPTRFDGVTLDVTMRREAEEELRASEERFSAFMNNSPTASWITDVDGRVEYISETYSRIFALPTASILGKRPTDLYAPEYAQQHIANIRQVAESGKAVEVEESAPRHDGSIGVFLVYKFPLRDRSGRTLVGGVAVDVTERKRAEREREQLLVSERLARTEAERASQMKDEFLATLSHELRTPLSAILGWSHLLRRGETSAEKLSSGLATIERNARAQAQIVEDLLDMSRIISGKVSLTPQRVDLGAVIRAALETVRGTASAKGIGLNFDVPASSRFPVLGDLNRLQQVFWNLLSNAIKFTARDGVINVQLEQRHSQWQVDITDTGEGISEEFMPFVFDRFRQADASTTRRHGGLGLGLAIVKQLVELHGGKVRVRSEGLGKGSTFTVSLPVSVIHADDPQASVGRLAATAGTTAENASSPSPAVEFDWDRHLADTIRGVRVVVVDDEPDARALLRHLLENCGCDVVTASTADEAVQLIEQTRPDVLVSDIGMPGEDGYTLLRRVRELGPHRGGSVPAIALTAYARAEDRMKAIRAGFQMHVPKPVEPAELITMVASLTKHSRS